MPRDAATLIVRRDRRIKKIDGGTLSIFAQSYTATMSTPCGYRASDAICDSGVLAMNVDAAVAVRYSRTFTPAFNVQGTAPPGAKGPSLTIASFAEAKPAAWAIASV